MVAEHIESLDVERIFISRAEGNTRRAYVSSISSAEEVLSNWSSNLPRGCEEGCIVKLTFEDGVHFSSYVLLTGSKKRVSLVRHLRTQIRNYLSRGEKMVQRAVARKTACAFEGIDRNYGKEFLLARYVV